MKRKKKPINSSAYPNLDTLEILERLKLVPNNRGQRAFLAALWLFGNRVSELLGIPPREVIGEYPSKRLKSKGDYYYFSVKKYRYIEDDIEDISKWEVPPVTRIKAQIDPKTQTVVMKAQTLKSKGRPHHDYRALIDLPEDKEAWDILTEYLSTKSGLEPIWSFRRTTAWYYCNKHLGVPPHKLRALRATRDAVTYGLDAIDLKTKFNWTDPGMAFYYASKNPHDLIAKMRRNIVKVPAPSSLDPLLPEQHLTSILSL